MKHTKSISLAQYNSPYFYDKKKEILSLVNKESQIIETVGEVSGTTGRPVPMECEVTF